MVVIPPPLYGRDADRIVVLDGGRVVEQSTHSTAIDKKRTYFNLVESSSNWDNGAQFMGHENRNAETEVRSEKVKEAAWRNPAVMHGGAPWS